MDGCISGFIYPSKDSNYAMKSYAMKSLQFEQAWWMVMYTSYLDCQFLDGIRHSLLKSRIHYWFQCQWICSQRSNMSRKNRPAFKSIFKRSQRAAFHHRTHISTNDCVLITIFAMQWHFVLWLFGNQLSIAAACRDGGFSGRQGVGEWDELGGNREKAKGRGRRNQEKDKGRESKCLSEVKEEGERERAEELIFVLICMRENEEMVDIGILLTLW